MFSDFSNSRRGIFDYVSDLKNKKISYREYEFKNEQPEEVEKFFDLDEKHTMEFSYHILKNLINNFLKTIESENIKFNEHDFLVKWKYYMPDLYEQYSELYADLSLSKKDKKKLGKKYIANVMKFLESFYQERLSQTPSPSTSSASLTPTPTALSLDYKGDSSSSIPF